MQNSNVCASDYYAVALPETFVKVQEFSIDLSEAKAYLYAYSTRHRIHKWEDLNISVFV